MRRPTSSSQWLDELHNICYPYGMKMFLKLFIGVLLAKNIYAKNEGAESIPLDKEVKLTRGGLDILKRSQIILSSKSVWNSKDNRKCSRLDKQWSLYCSLVKASMDLSGEFDHRLGVIEELRRTITSYSKNKKYEHRLMDFNNDSLTTFSDIKKVLSLTTTKVEKRLKLSDL